jgi:hypothetical protein
MEHEHATWNERAAQVPHCQDVVFNVLEVIDAYDEIKFFGVAQFGHVSSGERAIGNPCTCRDQLSAPHCGAINVDAKHLRLGMPLRQFHGEDTWPAAGVKDAPILPLGFRENPSKADAETVHRNSEASDVHSLRP